MKTFIILSLLVSGIANAQYINQLNDSYNGVDGSANPLHPQQAQPLQVAPMPNYNNQNNLQPMRTIRCQTNFGITTCN